MLGVNELLVIGSQAVHGSVDGDLPDEASRSVEVDVAAMHDNHGKFADLIDGAIGQASMFHDTFGYYAQGVVEATAVLPSGWRARLGASRRLRREASLRGAWRCTISGCRKPSRVGQRTSCSAKPCSIARWSRGTSCVVGWRRSRRSMTGCSARATSARPRANALTS